MLVTDLYRIQQFIDTFALGHYARVVEAFDYQRQEAVALKVLRPEHLLTDGDMRWEYRAFANEAQILTKLADSPAVMKLRDCGYLATRSEAPDGGEIISFRLDVNAFTSAMTTYATQGWRPYLALEYLPRQHNLFYLMRPNQQNSIRRRLPSEEGLSLALQFGNLLQLAHALNIVYLDHKLEHVYWDGQKLRVIDFNSSRQLKGVNADRAEYTKDIHNLCVGVLYPLFTGMSPQKAALRPQAGGMDEVERRYSDITELDFSVEPFLSPALQDLLQQGAAQQITTSEEFMLRLKQVAAQHGRDFPDYYTNPASRDARDQVRRGLELLRQGEEQVRQARDLFRDALTLENVSDDLEQELRRLVKQTTEMLNYRVIP